MFITTLFKLLSTPGTFVVIDGYEIDSIQDYEAGLMRCECGEENEWYFRDQEVEVDDDGQCSAVAVQSDPENDETEQVSLTTCVLRPIASADLA